MEQVSKIPTVVFWAGMLSFFFPRDSTLRRKTSRGRGNTGLYMVTQKTAIHTFLSSYRGGGNFSGMPLNSRLSTKDIWWYRHY